MKKLISFLLNTVHVMAVLFTGLQYNFADNLLNVMNTLVVFLIVMYVLVTAGTLHNPTKASLEPLIKNLNSKSFNIRQYFYYVPMIVLSSWFGLWGTLVLTLILGFVFTVAVVIVKSEYEKLTETE